ncbi:MAG: hypothetical protein ABI696_09105 [Rubrivivax sp.]
MLIISRSWRRSIARLLVGVLLFGQFMVAAYACPSAVSGSTFATATHASGAADVAPDGISPDCDGAMWAADAALPNLCAEHCKAGHQSDRAQHVSVPIIRSVAWTMHLPPPRTEPRRRAAACAPGERAAAAPPLAILHCVRRT